MFVRNSLHFPRGVEVLRNWLRQDAHYKMSQYGNDNWKSCGNYALSAVFRICSRNDRPYVVVDSRDSPLERSKSPWNAMSVNKSKG